MTYKEIPNTWLVLTMFAGMVVLRTFGIDTYVTAGISVLIGWVAGKHIEQARKNQ